MRLDGQRESGSLVYRASSIQLACDISAANQMYGFAHLLQWRQQCLLRFLPCTNNDVVYRQTFNLPIAHQMQALLINMMIMGSVYHRHAAFLQIRTMYPSGCFSQSFTHFAGFTLQ